MTAMPHLPKTYDEPVTVGAVLVDCLGCGQSVPVTVEAARIRDEDGDDCMWIEQNTADLELHMLSHDAEATATLEPPDES